MGGRSISETKCMSCSPRASPVLFYRALLSVTVARAAEGPVLGAITKGVGHTGRYEASQNSGLLSVPDKTLEEAAFPPHLSYGIVGLVEGGYVVGVAVGVISCCHARERER